MIKIICFLKKKDGLSFEQFKQYYEEKHAPLAIKLLPVFHEYSRSYISLGDNYEPSHISVTPLAFGFDVITQIAFETREDYDMVLKLQSDPEIARLLAEDEERFLDRSAMTMFIVDEKRTPAAVLESVRQTAG